MSFIFDDFLPDYEEDGKAPHGDYDTFGRSADARNLEALLAYLHVNRGSARQSSSLLCALMLALQLVEDETFCKHGSRGLYGNGVSPEYLAAIRAELADVTSWAISALAMDLDRQWHIETMTALAKPVTVAAESVLASACQMLFRGTANSDVRARVLRRTIHRIVETSGDQMINERWLAYSQSIDTARKRTAVLHSPEPVAEVSYPDPIASRAISQAVAPLLERSPRLERTRNDLASRLTAVPFGKANTDGLRLLRGLAAVAPASDSEDAFLPEQRTIFAIQHLTGWLLSDDDDADELLTEVEVRVYLLFAQFAPIVQARTGAHWSTMFDIISNNLEVSLSQNLNAMHHLTIGRTGCYFERAIDVQYALRHAGITKHRHRAGKP